MFQKNQLRKLDNRYNSHAYTGLMGIFMKYCHQQLEKIEFPGNISKVLEIGAGSAPHINYVKHNFNEYHIIETSDFAINQNFSNSKIKITKYDGQNIPFPNETFERIIISHCLEHIPFPEKFLFEMMSKLKPGGILSISLPTDPGLLFRLGRLYLKIFSIKKNYQITKEEFDYMNATEHINSIFALKSLINFHYKNKIKEFYLPFKIKLIDLNLFYNVHITK